jgi:hypothetical protein
VCKELREVSNTALFIGKKSVKRQDVGGTCLAYQLLWRLKLEDHEYEADLGNLDLVSKLGRGDTRVCLSDTAHVQGPRFNP